MNVKSRAHRVLSKLRGYRDCSTEQDKVQELFPSVQLAGGETCLGIYENSSDSDSAGTMILVTDWGIHLRKNRRVAFVAYDQIESVETPGDKSLAHSLHLVRSDGPPLEIPVAGGKDRFHDVYEFGRFLKRVVEDKRTESGRLKAAV
ncbi:hypothetical protein HYR69_00730 [Candidatus Sumerlaeota bacterium]|nr:hypothetical protein [Candidatus Sumerlaeota bacterium]